MGKPLDLFEIAQVEQNGGAGALFAHLDGLFGRADVQPDGFSDAVIWQMGDFSGNIEPLSHALTDKFSLVATLAALEILGLPSYLVPMMAQYRHDMKLSPLAWFGSMPGYGVKWSTAGDIKVDDGNGGTCVVAGKSGNARLRTDAGVYCNVRSIEASPGQWIRNVRAMPMLPYSQQKGDFTVEDDGTVCTFIRTPGDRLAYACRKFLSMVNDLSQASDGQGLGRAAIKPTQAMEDGIMAGLLTCLLGKTQMTVRKAYKVDAYEENREAVDRIMALLPEDFCDDMADWTGDIYLHIADTNYGILQHDFMGQSEMVLLSTDLDGDRLTDLMADSPKVLMRIMEMTVQHLGAVGKLNPAAEGPLLHVEGGLLDVWHGMGFQATTGMDMPSIMYRKSGLPIYEMTLGSADEMLDRLLDGHELTDNAGAAKSPYNPRIHFALTAAAARVANPDNGELDHFLTTALEIFDEVYAPGNHPTFLKGMNTLREKITPWGTSVAKAA